MRPSEWLFSMIPTFLISKVSLNMKVSWDTLFCLILLIASGCSHKSCVKSPDNLEQNLHALIDSVPGTVGIAVVGNQDTITLNNDLQYPMMSVFKLHQAIAVANEMERSGRSLDSIITIKNAELDKDTWSPMLDDYNKEYIALSIRDLLKYSLISSDNNASNILFRHIVSPSETDKFVRSISKDTTFRIAYTESEMKSDHQLSYCNYSSPLSATLLMMQIFTEDLLSPVSQDFIKEALINVTTGQDRLGAIKSSDRILMFAHKTGSGYRNNSGELMAFNDIGYFRLSDGCDYALGVMIRDFNGSEEEASSLMARISTVVFDYFKHR